MTTTADIVSAIDTVARGFVLADDKDWDGYEALHAERVSVDFGGVNDNGGGGAGGPMTARETRANAERVIGPVTVTQHQLSSFVVDVEGDEATVRFYEEALHVHPALGDDPARNTWTIFGKGTQRLVRTPDGWRISHASLVPTHSTGNPTFLADVAALAA
ncbi:nuclear transport factor 2 family protein [Streptomyces sp. NPDC026672]|uniref:nuclear transport factor 2 family protein n=1 Tax=unclassified Streptomyces TaxID=2593676 RepID=UPI0033E6C649